MDVCSVGASIWPNNGEVVDGCSIVIVEVLYITIQYT